MRRSLLVVPCLFALVCVPAALADGGPAPGIVDGWDGVTTPGSAVRYVTYSAGARTVVAQVRKSDGRTLRYTAFPGQWGVPMVAWNGTAGGLSRDGRTLVLGAVSNTPKLRTYSSFLILGTKELSTVNIVGAKGDLSFDALSPDAKTLYLIQHVATTDLTHYIVRSYDLARARLNPGAIADKTQRGWVMAGQPMARATSSDGRWVYTLYQRNGGYPFVHVLDAVRGVAHCVGIPWRGNQGSLWRYKLVAGSNGVTIERGTGKTFATIDTARLRFTRATTQKASFPWWIVVLILAVATPGSLLGRSLRRRRSVATPA